MNRRVEHFGYPLPRNRRVRNPPGPCGLSRLSSLPSLSSFGREVYLSLNLSPGPPSSSRSWGFWPSPPPKNATEARRELPNIQGQLARPHVFCLPPKRQTHFGVLSPKPSKHQPGAPKNEHFVSDRSVKLVMNRPRRKIVTLVYGRQRFATMSHKPLPQIIKLPF